ncbi:hypothetical protein ABZ915_31650 [Streptomyces sp. NPDC046915]|uniref:hypothetical protein n=1 Tax=Streptomyces sp. NPDC046915 TaxID=3155257 RepID=UPI0033C864D3
MIVIADTAAPPALTEVHQVATVRAGRAAARRSLRDFRAVRPLAGTHFRILPDDL